MIPFDHLSKTFEAAWESKRLCVLGLKCVGKVRAVVELWQLDPAGDTTSAIHALLLPLDPLKHGKTQWKTIRIEDLVSVELGELVDAETWHRFLHGNSKEQEVTSFDSERGF